MAKEQNNVHSLVVILIFSVLIIRFLFFSPAPAAGSAGDRRAGRRGGARGRADSPGGNNATAARERAVEHLQQIFPQVDRRAALWELQRNGGSVAAATERILAGRLE